MLLIHIQVYITQGSQLPWEEVAAVYWARAGEAPSLCSPSCSLAVPLNPTICCILGKAPKKGNHSPEPLLQIFRGARGCEARAEDLCPARLQQMLKKEAILSGCTWLHATLTPDLDLGPQGCCSKSEAVRTIDMSIQGPCLAPGTLLGCPHPLSHWIVPRTLWGRCDYYVHFTDT